MPNVMHKLTLVCQRSLKDTFFMTIKSRMKFYRIMDKRDVSGGPHESSLLAFNLLGTVLHLQAVAFAQVYFTCPVILTRTRFKIKLKSSRKVMQNYR